MNKFLYDLTATYPPLFLIPAMIVFGSPDPARCDDDPSLRQAFLGEAPGQWGEYLRFTSKLCGAGEYRSTSEGKKGSHWKFEFRQNSSCKLLAVEWIFPSSLSGRSDRLVHNQRYAFEVRKKPGAGSWVATELVTTQPLGSSRSFDGSESQCKAHSARLLCLDNSQFLPELLTRRTFRLLSVSRVNLGGANLVKVIFECPHPPEEEPGATIQAGTLVLDPEDHWVLRQASLQCKYRPPNAQVDVYRSEEEFQGRPYQTGFLVPVSFTHNVIRDKSPGYEQIVNYDLSVPDKPPEDEEFTLSAYGLPEPFDVAPPARPRWYLWVIGIVLVSFLGGYGLRKLGRKKP